MLRNTTGGGNHWLGVKLEGTHANRDGIGAIVHVKAGGVEQWNQASTSVGYASSSEVRVHFGLGAASSAEVEVTWPGGRVQKVGKVEADQYILVKE